MMSNWTFEQFEGTPNDVAIQIKKFLDDLGESCSVTAKVGMSNGDDSAGCIGVVFSNPGASPNSSGATDWLESTFSFNNFPAGFAQGQDLLNELPMAQAASARIAFTNAPGVNATLSVFWPTESDA